MRNAFGLVRPSHAILLASLTCTAHIIRRRYVKTVKFLVGYHDPVAE